MGMRCMIKYKLRERRNKKMRGLENPGSLCYLISLLQQFQAIPSVRQIFLKKKSVSGQNSDWDRSSDSSDSSDSNSDSSDSSDSSDGSDSGSDINSSNDRDGEVIWEPSRPLAKALIAARKQLKKQRKEFYGEEQTSAEKKLSKQRKYLIQFLTQFQLLLAHLASSPLPVDSDSDSDDSGADYNSDIDNGDEESGSEDNAISIIPFYQAIQKLTNDKENLSKPRDCSEFFSKICKIFLLCLQDSFFQKEFPLIVDAVRRFLTIFRGFVRHTITPVAWASTEETSPEIQQIESYYYLSIDISPGNLLLSLERFIAPSAPFLFHWPTASSSSSANEDTNNNKLLTFKCDELLCTVPTTFQHITLPSSRLNEEENANEAEKVNDSSPPIDTAPEVLVLQLRRFAVDFDAAWKAKRFDYFSFPSQLSFGNYLQFAHDTKRDTPVCDQHTAYRYALHGVVVHAGPDADDGHYMSLVRDVSSNKSRDTADNDTDVSSRWYWCDDDTVQPYSAGLRPLFGDEVEEDTEVAGTQQEDTEVTGTQQEDTVALQMETLTVKETNDKDDADNQLNNAERIPEDKENEDKDDDTVAMILFYLRVDTSSQQQPPSLPPL